MKCVFGIRIMDSFGFFVVCVLMYLLGDDIVLFMILLCYKWLVL